MRGFRIGPGPWAAVALATIMLFGPRLTQAQVKLEYKFPEGQKLTYKTTSKTSQVLTLMGQGIETESKETVVSSSAVGKKRADSTVPVDEKVESLNVELSLPGGMLVSYDSKDPDAMIDNPQLAFLIEVYKLISQLTYTVVLDGHNKVKAVEGTEKFLEKADALNEMAKQSIRSRLDAQRLKTQFEQSHSNLPEVLARPGEPWERTEKLELGGGQTLTFHKKFEYAGNEKRGNASLEKINVKTIEVSYKMDPTSPSPLKVSKSDLKVESGTGTILFDREGGHVVASNGKIRIKGAMTFTSAGQEIPGELDLTIESDTQLQPASK
jgi:Family of unknown function (DUF6263)